MTRVRRAHLWDLPAILQVLWAFTRRTAWVPNVRAWYTDARLMARLILRGKVRVIGGRARAFMCRDGARILALYVAPDHRGQGLGAALMAQAMRQEPWLELWTFETNEAARRFYKNCGFRELSRGNGQGNDECLPDIHMIWQYNEAQR